MKKLTGSEKQVAWAEDIRNSWIKKLDVLKEIEKRDDVVEEIKTVNPLDNSEHISTRKHFPLSVEENIVLEEATRKFTDKKILVVSGEQKEELAKLLQTIKDAANNENKASFWIERR